MSREGKGKLQISASALASESVGVTQLVELKATLFSKQREVREKERRQAASTAPQPHKTVSEKTSAIWRKPLKQKRRGREVGGGGGGGGGTREKELELSAEEEAQLEKSRRALEAKAALYDRLCGGEGVRGGGSDDSEEEGGEGRYMVDFTRKIVEERRAQESRQGNSSAKRGEEEEEGRDGQAEEDGEWVEYVDSFGRTRRCPREDLPHMKETEERLRQRSPTPDLLSEDMQRERERQRWEEEMRQNEEPEKPVGPVHYEAMRQGEVRSHGVGYYAFSKEEEKRSEQIGLLNNLRDQTVQQREKKLKLQEKRKALMEARLAKVRQRKQLKQPVVAEAEKDEGEKEEGEKKEGEKEEGEKKEGEEDRGTEVEVKIAGGEVDPVAAMIDVELGRAREKAEKGETEEGSVSKKKAPYVRPWDKGKVVDPIRKRKKELEDERLPEFAPPPSYDKTSDATPLPKRERVNHTDHSADDGEQPQGFLDSRVPILTTESQGQTDTEPNTWQSNTNSSSNPVGIPFRPPPIPPQNQYQYQPMQQPPQVGPYPHPPYVPYFGQYRGPLHQFGPPPPPPPGPIPHYTGYQPPYQFPYFHPPPPPPGLPPSQPFSKH